MSCRWSILCMCVALAHNLAHAGDKPEDEKWKGWIHLFAAKPDPDDPAGEFFAEPARNKWVLLPGGVLHNDLSKGDGKGTDIATKELFKDFDLHVELMIPRRSNSGIYLRGNIEIQVSDSHGKTTAPGNRDMGSIYSKSAPLVNAAGPPDTWQTFDFKVVGDRLTAHLNGKLIHGNQKLTNTPGQFPAHPQYAGKYDPTSPAGPGPLMIQGNHREIKLRNVYLKPIK